MPRCFIAVDVPGNQIQSIQAPGVRNVASYHITLKFLGDITRSELERIKQRLQAVRFHSFSIQTTSFGAFPNARRPNILWIGVESQELLGLQQRIDALLKDDFMMEKDYVPHITIARARSHEGREAIKDFLKQVEHKSFSWRVKNYSLYSSELTAEGPKYKEEKRYS